MNENYCSLYIFSHKDIPIIYTENEIKFDVDVNIFKKMYVGITNDIQRRWKEHFNNSKNSNYKGSKKFYNHIRNHFDEYNKTIIKTDMTKEEAYDYEIETISKYKTFALGLNSTPGGESPGCGGDNMNAEAVNIYNNTTGEILSFMSQTDAAKYMGISINNVSSVITMTSLASQAYSPLIGAWFQIKKAYDTTLFIENMKTHGEKIAQSLRLPIVVMNFNTKSEQEFTWAGEAADYFNISKTNIYSVLNRTYQKQFYVGTDRYDVQYLPKTREWDFDILPRHEQTSLRQKKSIIVVNIDTREEKTFDSIKSAAEHFEINRANIQSVLSKTHSAKQFYVGTNRYDVQKLPKSREWDFTIRSK